MTRWADARVGSYSKGMMQRVGIAQALVNDPQLVILDEPTDGVDPVGRREIRDVLLQLKNEGRTVFINSHLLSELEMMCDRVAILVAGRVVQQGTLDELTRERQSFVIELADADPAILRTALTQKLGITFSPAGQDTFRGTLSGNLGVEARAGTLRILTTEAAAIQPVIDALRSAQFIIRRIQPARPSLEDLFMEAVGGVTGGHSAGAAISAAGGRP